MPWTFHKINRRSLPQLVLPDAKETAGLCLNIPDILSKAGGKRRMVKELYSALLRKGLRYGLEQYVPSPYVQKVRTPAEIFQHAEGTCLDLALLFAGLCLGHELLPVVVMLQGHSLVAVSMNHGLREYGAYGRHEYARLFKDIELSEPAAVAEFAELVRTGAYLAIECTGFARTTLTSDEHPEFMGRGCDGTMSFPRAAEAGAEHFRRLAERPFQYALDIPVAHFDYDLGPDASTARLVAPEELGELLSQCDRHRQEQNLVDAVIRHRDTSPRRPLVCLMHGEGAECHKEFVDDRLLRTTLPQLLRRWYPGPSAVGICKGYEIKLSLDSYAPGKVAAAIEQDFRASALGRDPGVYKHFDDGHRCVFLHFAVYAEDCTARNLRRVREFLRYWSLLDDLPPGRLLIVCLNFRYRGSRYLMRTVEESFRRWQIRLRNRRAKRLVHKLGVREIPGITLATLCELEAVSQIDAELLVDLPRLRDIFNVGYVTNLFERGGDCVEPGHMQMFDLFQHMTTYYEKRLERLK